MREKYVFFLIWRKFKHQVCSLRRTLDVIL